MGITSYIIYVAHQRLMPIIESMVGVDEHEQMAQQNYSLLYIVTVHTYQNHLPLYI